MTNIGPLVHCTDVIAQPSGESLVLFQMESGKYFSLNESGARIWECCDGSRTAEEITDLLMEEYDASPQVSNDVTILLQQLVEKGLLKAANQV
jgi:hypothetical protein